MESNPTKTNARLFVSRKEIFAVLKRKKFGNLSQTKCITIVYKYILNKFCVSVLCDEYEKSLKTIIKLIVSKMMSKWKTRHRNNARFIQRNCDWLNTEIRLPSLTYPIKSISKSRQAKKTFCREFE